MYEENIKKKKADEAAEQSNPALYSQDLNKVKETVDPVTPSSSAGTSNNGSNNYDLYQQDLTVEQDPNSVYMDEIQKALHDKNYKALLQSDIAAYNLKMNTQKYLDQNLAAQGLGTQGYGTTAHVGVENQAQNLYAQNLENYNQNEADYLAEAQERKSNEELDEEKQLISFLQASKGDEEVIAKHMSNYGYVQSPYGGWYKADENGNPDMSSPAPKAILSAIDDAIANLKEDEDTFVADAIGEGKKAFNVQEITTGIKTAVNIDDAFRVIYKYFPENKNVANELYYMFMDNNFNSDLSDGTVVKLANGHGEGADAYFIYHDGAWYPTSQRYYAEAGSKKTLTSKDGHVVVQ